MGQGAGSLPPSSPGWSGPALGLPRPRGETASSWGDSLAVGAVSRGVHGVHAALAGVGHLRSFRAPPLGLRVPLSLEYKFPGLPSMETPLSSPILQTPPVSGSHLPLLPLQLRRPRSPGRRGGGHGHHRTHPGPGASAPEGLWVRVGECPASILSSRLPSQCVLGMPWPSFCPDPSQPRQPQSAGPSSARLR